MLVSEIISEVIQDVGGDTSDTDLTSLMLNWAKSTLRRFPIFSRSRLFNTTSSVTLSSGTSSATLPTGFLREIYIYRKSGGADIEIEKHPNFKNVVNTTDTGTPLYYEIIGTTIYFDKAADSNYTIYIEHSKEIDGVASTDTWPYSSTMLEILKDGMKYYYYKYTEDSANASEQLALMKSGLDQLEQEYMIDQQGGHIDES